MDTVRFERANPRPGVAKEAITVTRGTTEEQAWAEAAKIDKHMVKYHALPEATRLKMFLNRMADAARELQKLGRDAQYAMQVAIRQKDLTVEDRTAMIKLESGAILQFDLLFCELDQFVGDETRRHLEWTEE